MDARAYKLTEIVYAHQSDVRNVCAYGENESSFVSCSRDSSARLWTKTENGIYECAQTMSGHSGFVQCVMYLGATSDEPKGCVLTGGQDGKILCFRPGESLPTRRINAHSNSVCFLTGGLFGMFISGSWDHTAKVWEHFKEAIQFKGHSAAVWCGLQMTRSLYLTGSADKTIRVWEGDGLLRTITGHNDVVRGLTAVNEEQFVSCCNDSQVRLWTVTGQLLMVFGGHEKFVYSISSVFGHDLVASCGEDATLRVWSLHQPVALKIIPHRCTTIWSCAALPNGDLITGGSDGHVRVFSANPDRPEVLEAAADSEAAGAPAHTNGSASSKPSGISAADLPGHEALATPGSKDGQTRLIGGAGNTVEVYEWRIEGQEWQQVGTMVGSAAEGQVKAADGGKIFYERKPYDFVFSVETDDDRQLKLPFNRGDNEWAAAQQFIDDHLLPQDYLDRIAKFIVGQVRQADGVADDVAVGAASAPHSAVPVGFNSDPFTGGDSYVTGTSHTKSWREINVSNVNPQGPSDPLTGENRYQPTESSKSVDQVPQKQYRTYTSQSALEKLLSRLSDYQQELERSGADVPSFALIAGFRSLVTADSVDGLTAKLAHLHYMFSQWPDDKQLPVVDLLRLVVLEKWGSQYFCGDERAHATASRLFSLLQYAATCGSAPLAWKLLCCFCNLFRYEQAFVTSYSAQLLALFDSWIAQRHSLLSNELNQQVVTALLLNMSVWKRLGGGDESLPAAIIGSAARLLEYWTARGDAAALPLATDALLNWLQAVGTTAYLDDAAVAMARSVGLDARCRALHSTAFTLAPNCRETLQALVALL